MKTVLFIVVVTVLCACTDSVGPETNDPHAEIRKLRLGELFLRGGTNIIGNGFIVNESDLTFRDVTITIMLLSGTAVVSEKQSTGHFTDILEPGNKMHISNAIWVLGSAFSSVDADRLEMRIQVEGVAGSAGRRHQVTWIDSDGTVSQ